MCFVAVVETLEELFPVVACIGGWEYTSPAKFICFLSATSLMWSFSKSECFKVLCDIHDAFFLFDFGSKLLIWFWKSLNVRWRFELKHFGRFSKIWFFLLNVSKEVLWCKVLVFPGEHCRLIVTITLKVHSVYRSHNALRHECRQHVFGCYSWFKVAFAVYWFRVFEPRVSYCVLFIQKFMWNINF